jgi:hypothetical protein
MAEIKIDESPNRPKSKGASPTGKKSSKKFFKSTFKS